MDELILAIALLSAIGSVVYCLNKALKHDIHPNRREIRK